MKKKIAIIGAGISGLFFANLLKKESKYDFILYEKNSSINFNEGYGIQFSVNSVSILNKIGFENFDIKEKFNPEKINLYSSENFKRICNLNISQFNLDNVYYTCLKRSSFIKFLYEGLLTNDIQFDSKIKKINYQNSKIEIIFENDTSDVVDYLVVSDGIFSPTKSILFSDDININYTGSLAIRGILKKNNLKFFDPKNISLLLGSNFHLVVYPLNRRNEFNLITIIRKKLHKNILNDGSFFKDDDNIEKILNEIFSKKNANLMSLFENSENLKSFPIFLTDKIRQPNHSNIFFLGDALFALLPTFAQGASQSIESAYELFDILNTDIRKNFKKYYGDRIKRIKKVELRSKLNYFGFHLSNPLLVLIRNIILKIIANKPKLLNKYLGPVYKKF